MSREEQFQHMREAYRRGWAIIPLKEGRKEPNLPKGHTFLSNRPTDEEYSKFEWGNYGIVCGPLSKLCVLDIDGDKGLQNLSSMGHAPSDFITPKVKTPNGWHIYFQFNPAVKTSVGELGDGLDIRSKGSYVVGAGSEVNGEDYQLWYGYKNELLPAPDWMKVLPKSLEDDTMASDFYSIPGRVKKGERNDKLLRLASYFIAKDMPPEMVLDMVTHFNKVWVDPPVNDNEVKGICVSAERYRKGKAGVG